MMLSACSHFVVATLFIIGPDPFRLYLTFVHLPFLEFVTTIRSHLTVVKSIGVFITAKIVRTITIIIATDSGFTNFSYSFISGIIVVVMFHDQFTIIPFILILPIMSFLGIIIAILINFQYVSSISQSNYLS